MEKLLKMQIVQFGMVGAVSTIIDMSLMNILEVLGVISYVSVGLGFLAGALNGYLMNSKMVFKRERSKKEGSKYLFIGIIGFFLTELIVHVLYVEFNMALNAAKLISVALVFFWNYFGSKIWAFK